MKREKLQRLHKMGSGAIYRYFGDCCRVKFSVAQLVLELVEHFFLGFEENTLMPVSTHIAGGQRFLSVLIGGIIAAIVWFIVQTKMKPTVGINKAMDGDEMPFWPSVVHAVTQVF